MLKRSVHTGSESDPESARFITDDIPRFWAAFEHLDAPDAVQVFDELYLQVGTPGLQAFTELQIENAAALVETLRAKRDYYAAVRPETLRLGNVADQCCASFLALSGLYPAAVFPDTTLMIGRMNSGGTVSEAGLLIGLELFTRTAQTPTHELNAWELAVTSPVETLPLIVAHELIHAQQPPAVSYTLLSQCLREGAAEFLGKMISGGVINPGIHEYGQNHEVQLWARFDAEKTGHQITSWLYQGTKAQGEPADLGYFIGAQICRAYLGRTADKRRAIYDIINRAVIDPESFLAASGYAMGV